MTPAARVAAAIEILDATLAGAAAEQVLTTWARRNRFAGSGDRAAIRDLVFDALRCRRSFGWLGGGDTGRALMIGALRVAGTDLSEVFSSARFAPEPLAEGEVPQTTLDTAPEAVALDCPDWLVAPLRASLGDDFSSVMECLKSRAPLFLRVNTAKATVAEALAKLTSEGIEARPHPLASTALEVVGYPRRVAGSAALKEGVVEVQDAASQAVVEAVVGHVGAGQLLDYCAGGGGKALALAAGTGRPVIVHDADPGRMRDIPARAARAGADLRPLDTASVAEAGPFSLVFADVPCSGSGAWRRQAEARWRLTPERLEELNRMQAEILDRAVALVAPGGHLAYATCSLLRAENDDVTSRFLDHAPTGWHSVLERRFTPLDGGDGFYIRLLRAPKGGS